MLYSAKFRPRESSLPKMHPTQDMLLAENANGGRMNGTQGASKTSGKYNQTHDERELPRKSSAKKDQEGDTDMAEEGKLDGEADDVKKRLDTSGDGYGLLDRSGHMLDEEENDRFGDDINGVNAHSDLDDDDGDTLQDEASGNLQPREGSIEELINKYQGFVDKDSSLILSQQKKQKSAPADGDDDEEEEDQ